METPLKQFCRLADKVLNDVMGNEQSEGKLCFDDKKLVAWLFLEKKENSENNDKKKDKQIYDRIYHWLQEKNPRTLDWEWKRKAEIVRITTADCGDNYDGDVDSIIDDEDYDAVGVMRAAIPNVDNSKDEWDRYDEHYYVFLDNLKASIQKELADDFNIESLNKLSFGEIVMLFLIRGYYGGKIVEKIPCSVNTKYFVERAEVEEKLNLNDARIIQVIGPHWSGKTTLLINYAKEKGIEVIYCEEKITFESFIEELVFESEKYIKEICEIDHREHTLVCLRKMTEPLWVILVGAAIDRDLIRQLRDMNPAITIIIEETEKVLQDDPLFDEANVIEVEPMDKGETKQLFNLIKGKYLSCPERSNPELAEVQDAIQNNPILIILVAEQYWSLVKDGREEAAKKFLDDIVAFQVDAKEYGEIYSTIGYEDSGRQGQHKILNHIKRLFLKYVPEMEKNVFYVLSLISSIELEVKYIMKWFGIKEDSIKELERSGWCVVNADSMQVGIPQLIIQALKYDIYENAGASKGFKTYIENMTETILRNEATAIEAETMEKVILCLHDKLLNKIHEHKSLVSETECIYHFACIKYFLDFGNSVDVKRLMDEAFEYEKIRDGKGNGSSLYFETLKLVMKSEDANDTMIIVDGLMNILGSEKMKQVIKLAKDEEGCVRLLECVVCAVMHSMDILIQKEVIDHVLDWSKGEPKAEDADKYKAKFQMFMVLMVCLENMCDEISLKRPQIGKIRAVCMIYKLTIACFVGGFPLEDRVEFEEKILTQLKIFTENKESIANMEIELLAKSLFLLTYEQSCLEAGWTGKQNEDDRFDRRFLENKVKDILELRKKFIELPAKLGAVFYAAKWMAGCLLGNRMDLMTKDERDFRNIRNQNGIERDLKKMMQEYQMKIDGTYIVE